MLTRRIIPCLDTKNGRVVKGIRFQNLADAGCPAELASRYEKEGADEIVLLDIAATVEERKNQLETVRRVRDALSIPLTVGGGVRNMSDIESLLDAGADKVSLNTAAVRDPRLITSSARSFGAQCIVVAIDAKKSADIGDGKCRWRVLTRSGTSDAGLDVVQWAAEASECGAGEILLTSFDRDGTKNGYDLALLEAVSRAVPVPVIASGGASCASDLYDAIASGADAVLAASIFHFRETSIGSVKIELAQKGVSIRI